MYIPNSGQYVHGLNYNDEMVQLTTNWMKARFKNFKKWQQEAARNMSKGFKLSLKA